MFKTFRLKVNNEKLTFEQLLERDKDKLGEIARIKEANQVAPEEMLLAEFGVYYGFEAMVAAMNDEITFKKMNDLVRAGRVLEAQKRYNRVIDIFVANAAIQTKNPNKAVNKHLKEISKIWQ